MKSEDIKMTTSQFAGLHGVNKRTLHYYDNIGLFSPRCKGENNYRYYDYHQSLEFEYIRMLKELNMSIEEIKAYCGHPNEEDFLDIADTKIRELDLEIQKLKKTKSILKDRKRQLESCRAEQENGIGVTECSAQSYLITPFDFEEDNLQELFAHLKEVWSPEQYRMGVGSYISVDKVRAGSFEKYDGLFTPAQGSGAKKNVITRPKGTYLYGYQKGDWSNLPGLYKRMLEFAEDKGMTLTGYAYETGVNDFAISDISEYVTRVLIKADID